MKYVLVINPGSTSTKIAVFGDNKILFEEKKQHSGKDLSPFKETMDQLIFRKGIVTKMLKKHNFDKNKLSIVMGRGGLIKSVESGIYHVTQKLEQDLINEVTGRHASNLGGLIAKQIASDTPNAKAYIADPVVVDELQDIARISGHPLFKRKSIFHALNHKAVGRWYAQSIGKEYEKLNLIIAHMGGGISIAAHKHGRAIDVNQALDGEGPLSPERSGTLPTGDLIDLCFSNKYPKEEIKKMVVGKGGWMGFLGINDSIELNKRVDKGDGEAFRIREALSYQTAKYIGSMATVLEGKVDAIILTGGLAYCEHITEYIARKTSYIADSHVIPGENEMQALALNAYLLLEGKVKEKNY
jgi:butyrate kinase